MVNTSSDKTEALSSSQKGKGKYQKTQLSRQKIALNILEGISDHITVLDKKGIVLYINKDSANDLGFEPNELMGKNFWEIFPKLKGTPVQKHFFEARDRQQAKRFEWKTVYSNSKFKEFALFPSSKWVTFVSRDITEKKKIEDELFKSRELLNNIINSTDSVIIARDLNEKLILLNTTQSKIYKMPVEEALGTTPYDIYPKNVADEIMAWDKKVFSEKKSFRYEETLMLDGKPRTFVTNKFPLFDSDGKIYGLGGVITDITERKEMETKLSEYAKNLEALVEERTRQLQEKERLAAIGQTAGMVGHDIRNPLQSIAGDIYLLDCDIATLQSCDIKKSMQESIISIQENVQYIDKIVEDLKNFAKRLEPHLQKTSIEKIIEDALLIVPIPSNLEVIIDVEKGFPSITVDGDMLKRALSNLVQNAVQAMPQGGKLTLGANRKGKEAIISVKDTGSGIPEELKPKLFQPMVTTKAKGQGLGLAVVKRLVEVQGGTIGFESQVGVGTKFYIKLPLEQ